jgi:hypothetical protein
MEPDTGDVSHLADATGVDVEGVQAVLARRGVGPRGTEREIVEEQFAAVLFGQGTSDRVLEHLVAQAASQADHHGARAPGLAQDVDGRDRGSMRPRDDVWRKR